MTLNLLNPSTLTSSSGLKTRNFSTIIEELTACLRIHNACNSRLGGVSLEFTGELNEEGFSVTECVGGSMELSEEELGLRYQVCTSARALVALFKMSSISSRSAIHDSISSRALVCCSNAYFSYCFADLFRRCVPYLQSLQTRTPEWKQAWGCRRY